MLEHPGQEMSQLRLRFDFSSSSDLDIGGTGADANIGGVYLAGTAAYEIYDGQKITINSANGDGTKTFQFQQVPSVVLPDVAGSAIYTGSASLPGETFSVANSSGQSQTFRFVTAGTDEISGDTWINLTPGESTSDVVSAILNATNLRNVTAWRIRTRQDSTTIRGCSSSAPSRRPIKRVAAPSTLPRPRRQRAANPRSDPRPALDGSPGGQRPGDRNEQGILPDGAVPQQPVNTAAQLDGVDNQLDPGMSVIRLIGHDVASQTLTSQPSSSRRRRPSCLIPTPSSATIQPTRTSASMAARMTAGRTGKPPTTTTTRGSSLTTSSSALPAGARWSRA